MARRLGVVAGHVCGPDAVTAVATKSETKKMPAQLRRELEGVRERAAFSPRRWIDGKVAKLNEYLRTNRLSGCVVSVSGGIDSAVTYV